jgi:hypothetical protein
LHHRFRRWLGRKRGSQFDIGIGRLSSKVNEFAGDFNCACSTKYASHSTGLGHNKHSRNPPLAHQALNTDDKIATMLPRRVIVQDLGGGQIAVAAISPQFPWSMVGN